MYIAKSHVGWVVWFFFFPKFNLKLPFNASFVSTNLNQFSGRQTSVFSTCSVQKESWAETGETTQGKASSMIINCDFSGNEH